MTIRGSGDFAISTSAIAAPKSSRTGTATRSRRSDFSVPTSTVASFRCVPRHPILLVGNGRVLKGPFSQEIAGPRAVGEPAARGGPFYFKSELHDFQKVLISNLTISRLRNRLVDLHQPVGEKVLALRADSSRGAKSI